jgi:hypothetical protein
MRGRDLAEKTRSGCDVGMISMEMNTEKDDKVGGRKCIFNERCVITC